ncbi:DUF6542 domain-containing protein [Streptomyces sp. ST1020]|uniref:DUF6542 domain-containing protein n=2 Tax=unclassified Streptomyces TaxID=2593676 RepID=UPI0034C6C2A5
MHRPTAAPRQGEGRADDSPVRDRVEAPRMAGNGRPRPNGPGTDEFTEATADALNLLAPRGDVPRPAKRERPPGGNPAATKGTTRAVRANGSSGSTPVRDSGSSGETPVRGAGNGASTPVRPRRSTPASTPARSQRTSDAAPVPTAPPPRRNRPPRTAPRRTTPHTAPRYPTPRLTGLGSGLFSATLMTALGLLVNLLIGDSTTVYAVLYLPVCLLTALWTRRGDLVSAPVVLPIAFAVGIVFVADGGDGVGATLMGLVTALATQAGWLYGGTLAALVVVAVRRFRPRPADRHPAPPGR